MRKMPESVTGRKAPISRHWVLVVVSMLMVLSSPGVHGEVDWGQTCGTCSCKWVSGKKTADCRNASLSSVPTELSSELQVLDLSQNNIPEIRREEFSDANLQNVHKLFMRNCTLQDVHRDALKGLLILIELDLSNNLIRTLPVGVFGGLIKLRTVILNNNQIEVLEDRLFENLKFLYRIELKNNHLRTIGLNTFVDVPVLLQIYLDSNKLSILKKESFEGLEKLASLSILQNPWNCSCELQHFRDFIISRNLYTNPTTCHDPPHLRGKAWSDVPSENFACRPRIVMPRAGASLDAGGDNVTLTCRIKGSPKPDISWIFNKKPLNSYDTRIHVRNSLEPSRRDGLDSYTSDLTIVGVRTSDKGTYTCVAANRGGKDEANIVLAVPANSFGGSGSASGQFPKLLLVVCLITIGFLLLLLIVVFLFCCYCRRVKKYNKNGSISENGLVVSKIDKSQNESMLEGGSVIMEMQKSLLTEVNPVEKPPRRSDVESNGAIDTDDGHEVKKTLLDETAFGSHDDETQSVALSDTTPRSRQTFVDDGYGTNLPPDLLAFPAHFSQSPSLQTSVTNMQDHRLYGKSPLSSPVYQPTNPSAGVYATGFRTLQHPAKGAAKVANHRAQSPFTPAPLLYQPVVMKQGYVTIPRKPRTPSWSAASTPTTATTAEFPATTPADEYTEPVYDNLGLRTTAAGNSVLNLNKLGTGKGAQKYTMKDRPLPATPSATLGQYEPLGPAPEADTPYGAKTKPTKIPPRPPPKPPKKKLSVTSVGSTSQLFEDEGEDGTEV
ncbi:leucine-rich repeat-containing protein 24 [Lutzomyia longipalpis]|uniref:leucine-rich repeat-containing protein 24 n=1 Tax=Lutzomyia longipalpis TaxID=7200 RepID=UPI0024834B72|nr:leucine-rich repeat-containing protein 24 [Lutzomyia longipalpis]XP_055685413.1 leucine-rich repeat-containing protein 24 [Lutzomyia longipalpis]